MKIPEGLYVYPFAVPGRSTDQAACALWPTDIWTAEPLAGGGYALWIMVRKPLREAVRAQRWVDAICCVQGDPGPRKPCAYGYVDWNATNDRNQLGWGLLSEFKEVDGVLVPWGRKDRCYTDERGIVRTW